MIIPDIINNIQTILNAIGDFISKIAEFVVNAIKTLITMYTLYANGSVVINKATAFVLPTALLSIIGVCMGLTILLRIYGRD